MIGGFGLGRYGKNPWPIEWRRELPEKRAERHYFLYYLDDILTMVEKVIADEMTPYALHEFILDCQSNFCLPTFNVSGRIVDR